MKKFSKNPKLNKLYNYIYDEFKENEGEFESGINDNVIYCYENNINYYYNGCASFVYTEQLRQILKDCGYKNTDKYNNIQLDNIFINVTNYMTYRYYLEVKSKLNK